MDKIVLAGVILALPCLVAAAAGVEPLPPPRHGGIYVVAHRGAHQGIPENTLAAYRKAIDLGADYVEVDLRATKDGDIVSMHNSTVDNYTKDTQGPVKGFTLAELKAMDIGSRVGPEWRDERIPTFDEILDLCKGKIGIYLDLKDAPVEQIIEKIRARGMERDVLWYAGAGPMRHVKEHCPECILMPDPGIEKLLPHVLKQWEPKVVATTWGEFSQEFVKVSHGAGAIVITDDKGPESWQGALEWGVDGIQTDEPEQLIQLLEKRAQEKKNGADTNK